MKEKNTTEIKDKDVAKRIEITLREREIERAEQKGESNYYKDFMRKYT